MCPSWRYRAFPARGLGVKLFFPAGKEEKM